MKIAISIPAFLAILLAALQPSQAQTQIGIHGGLSVPDLSGGNNEISRGYTSRLAPNFGIAANFRITRNFSIQPEINFDGQGGQRNGLQPVTSTNLPPLPSGGYYYADFKNTSILNYLEIPILAKYTFGRKGVRFYVNAGPYFGYLLNATQKTIGSSSIYTDRNKTPLEIPNGTGGYTPLPPQSFEASSGVTSSLHRMNFGIAGGVGVIVPVTTRGGISLDLRGLYGFVDVQKYAVDGTSHTGNLMLTVGYMDTL